MAIKEVERRKNNDKRERGKRSKRIHSNRGDMCKIHVTRQFYEARGRQDDFFEKKQKAHF